MFAQTKNILVIAALLFIFSCNTKQEQSPLSFSPKVVEARGYVVPKDSMAKPKVIPARKPKIVRVGKPKVVLINTNVHPAGISRIVEVGVPKVCTPGQDGFSLPKIVPAIDSPFMAGIPEVVTAKEPYTREQNPQNFSFFGKLQGLKGDNITCWLEDKSGNLWFSNGDDGVSKYDGKSFTHFTEKEGLSSNYVTCMLEDKRGALWIGTQVGGVSKYDGKNFTRFTQKEGLSDNWVSSIVQDKSGNLWFGTHNGLCKYDGKSFTHFTAREGLSSNGIGAMMVDKSGNLWFVGRGVTKYDGKSFTNFTKKKGVSYSGVLTILQDKSDNLWFGTWGGGVIKYDKKSFSRFTTKEGLSNNSVWGIVQDDNGNLWMATDNGVSKYDGKSFTNFAVKEGLSDSIFNSVLKDKRGNLWFGTPTRGVNKYGGKMFTHFTVKEGLSDNHVTSMLEDRSGNLWFGTWGGGVIKYDGKSFAIFNFRQGLDIGSIEGMMEDKSGNLWFGSWDGVVKYDGKTFAHLPLQEGLDLNVKTILEDKQGNLWFGTYGGGVNKYNGKTFTRFTQEDGLSNNIVMSSFEDKSGNLWFGTYGGGVSKYDGKNFTHFTEKGGLGNNNVWSIHEDKSGNLWFGTDGGVSKYDGKNFTHFTEKEGLSNNEVKSILEDKNGNLWFATRFGISKLEKDKLGSFTNTTAGNVAATLSNSGLLFKTYTYEDGFSGIGVKLGKTICEAKDGTIWIGAVDRLTAFHPGEETPDTVAPGMQLTGLTLYNENIPWQNLIITNEENGNKPRVSDTSIVLGNGVKIHNVYFDSVSKWYGIPGHLSLPYNNNYLTFQFVGITTRSPKKVKYQYKLEGFDRNWNALTSRSEATYGNLPHGTYTFKVKAVNGDGYWSKEFDYAFTIRPPWWQTWWAYGVYALLAAAVIWLIVYYRLRSLRRELEQRKKEQQLVELTQEKTQLELQALRAQMNPHFIFNCLNSINRFILSHDAPRAADYLTKFAKLIRIVLQQSGKSFIPLEDELYCLQLYMDLEALRFERPFTYAINYNGIDTSSVMIPSLLMQPFVENAIWHGLQGKNNDDNGRIDINVSLQDNILHCKICDNGVGRAKSTVAKQLDPSRKSLGIKLTRHRLELVDPLIKKEVGVVISDIAKANGDNAGTCVDIKIPVKMI